MNTSLHQRTGQDFSKPNGPPLGLPHEGIAAVLMEPWPVWVGLGQHPEWQGQPVAAVSKDRVLAANARARNQGVTVGGRAQAAVTKVEGLKVYPCEAPALEAAWQVVLEDLAAFSPWLEPLAPGRVLLRVNEEEAHVIAQVYSARVGFSRFREVAMLAALAAHEGRLRKVESGKEKEYTDALPVYLLRGVGLTTRSLEWLRQLRQLTVGDLRQWSHQQLSRTLPEYKALKPFLKTEWGDKVARGKAIERVELKHEFGDDTLEPWQFEPVLLRLAERASRALKDRDKAARRLRISVKAEGQGYQATRLAKEPLKQAKRIYKLARLALEDTLAVGLSLEVITLELSTLHRPAIQDGLWGVRAAAEEAQRRVQECYPEVTRKVQTLDPYALSAVDRARWVPVFGGELCDG